MSTPAALQVDPKGDWLADAREAIEALARTGRKFTSDDLREMVGDPAHANWFGNAFNSAHQAKIIKPVGFRQSRAKSRRGGVLREWKGQS